MTSYIYNMVDTWNNGATTFTAIKMNVTDSASNASSLLMDLQVGTVSKFSVSKSGTLSPQGDLVFASGAGRISRQSGFGGLVFDASNNITSSVGTFTIATLAIGSADTFLTRRAAANLQLGAADAAAPVAQTLSVQSVVAGTTNTAGTNLTITGSQGTGTGAGGSIIFQVAAAGSSGSAQNALATALTIVSASNIVVADSLRISRQASFGGIVFQSSHSVELGPGTGGTFSTGSTSAIRIVQPLTVATLPTPLTGMMARVTDALAPTMGTTVAAGGAAQALVWYNGANWTVIGV